MARSTPFALLLVACAVPTAVPTNDNTAGLDVVVEPLVTIVRGESAELTASVAEGAPPLRCEWRTSAGSVVGEACEGVVVSPEQTTSYAVLVRDAHGRSGLAVVDVIVTVQSTTAEVLTVSTGPNRAIIVGEVTTISLTVSGGAGPVSCSWAKDAQIISSTCTALTVQPMEDSIYTLVAFDAGGALVIRSVDVRVYAPLATGLTPAQTQIVIGESIELQPTLGGGAPPLSCEWSTGTAVSNVCDDVVFSPTSTTTYSLTVTDANGNVQQRASEILVLRVEAIATPAPVVEATSFTLSAVVHGLVGVAHCEWRDAFGAVLNDVPGGCTLTYTPDASMEVVVTVTDQTTQKSTSGAVVPVTFLPSTCDDLVMNGKETGVDCGGRNFAWVNELYLLDITPFSARMAAVELVAPTGVTGLTTVFYRSNNNGYSPAPTIGLGSAPPTPVYCLPSEVAGLNYWGCGGSFAMADSFAVAVVHTPSNTVVDFVRLLGPLGAAAVSGPAHGLTPRFVIELEPNYYPLSGSFPPQHSGCLAGTGDRQGSFTWQSCSPPTMPTIDAASTPLGPSTNQTVTGFFTGCPSCSP